VQRTRPVKNGLQTAQKLLEHYGTLCHLAQLVSAKLTRSHHLVGQDARNFSVPMLNSINPADFSRKF
jgi:hypothetical protein